MWQRFTERARRVIFFAQEEAGRLGENYVSTEHILLGLLRENDSVAARLLDLMGFSLSRIRSEVERQVVRGDGRCGKDMQLTPRAKRVIDLAYDEAQQLSNNYIGTEHLLVGLIREGEGLAGRVLARFGVDLERTRQEVMLLQDNDPTGSPPPRTQTSNVKDRALDSAFVGEFDALSEEDRAAITGPGIALDKLPPPMRHRIQREVLSASSNGKLVPLAEGIVRVHVATVAGARHCTVTAATTLFMTILAPDSDEQRQGATQPDAAPQDQGTAPEGRYRWQQYTERARRVVFYAQEEAITLGSGPVDSEHLLLGLLRENDSAAGRVLDRMGVSRSALRDDLLAQLPRREPSVTGDAEFTPRGEALIEAAYEEAKLLGDNYIGTEHLLLGQIRAADGLARSALDKAGVDLEKTRAVVRLC
jgi:ATP-dependent Clp protease ATP-binding subunit ClpA